MYFEIVSYIVSRTGISSLNGRRREKKKWNINPFNKLIIDEIYRTFTVRVGGANVLLLS